MSQADAAFLELMQMTGWDRPHIERFRQLPADIQQLELLNYKDQDWSDPGTSAGQRFLALLALIGTIAGVVSGVAGAGSAIRTLTGH